MENRTTPSVVPKLKITEAEAINAIKCNKPTSGYIILCEALDMAVEALEKQISKKPYLDNDNGVYEKEHCPTCHRSLFPNDHHCRCGQALDWTDRPTEKGGAEE